MLESDVLLGRATSIPYPAVIASSSSGSISPNSRPPVRAGGGGDEGGFGDAAGGRCVMDLDACAFEDTDVRGRLILLAKDCELLDM